jgi:carotenoid cleavage dioxygenase-like enzyme
MTVTNDRDQPMLRGMFVPVRDECELSDLRVTGHLPAGLSGTFVRNGPNPMFEPLGRYHMFDGDGMLHAITIDEGRASYRNRWIRTAGLEAEMKAGRALYGGLGDMHMPGPDEVGDAGPMKNLANTNIVEHAGRLLALWEAGPPIEVTRQLDTIGPYDFGRGFDRAFTAHPKIDPRTGEMLAFAYLGFPPYLQYFEIAPDGTMARAVDIELPEAVVMHDFAITENHVVFVDSPMVLDIMGALKGAPMFRWDPDHTTRVGVMPRNGDQVTWYETDAAYINHFWNAWEDGTTITFAGSRLVSAAYTAGEDGAMDREGADAEPGRPTRFAVDLDAGTVKVEQFDDMGGDYPRINDAYCGVRSRYLYMGGFRDEATIVGHFDTIGKYDDVTGTRTTWHCGPNCVTGEAVFAPDPDGTTEDDGWLLACVTDRTDDHTDLVVLDARDVAAGPVARVHVPVRVPFGFHANWLGADS